VIFYKILFKLAPISGYSSNQSGTYVAYEMAIKKHTNNFGFNYSLSVSKKEKAERESKNVFNSKSEAFFKYRRLIDQIYNKIKKTIFVKYYFE